ncbi:MAG: hypothetical protein ACE5M4_01655 [Anaerolineales bacterium]
MATPLRVPVLEDRPLDSELMVLELRRAGLIPNGTYVGINKGNCGSARIVKTRSRFVSRNLA